MEYITFGDALIHAWRDRLQTVIGFYETFRDRTEFFFPKFFGAFFILNIASYWIAISTAFPQRAFGEDWDRYTLIQFPVGFLGAMFDIFSLVFTVAIIRRAVASHSKLVYLFHVGVDLVIAVLATAWVLIVFSVSTWLVDTRTLSVAPALPTQTQVSAPAADVSNGVSQSEILAQRSGIYRKRFIDALADPFRSDNLKNIYFGVIMGASAMLPSLVHLYMGIISLLGQMLRPRTNETG